MSFVLNRRLYTDKDQKLILEDGDPKAAYLIGGEGTTLTDDIAKKYGLDESHRLKEGKAKTAETDEAVTATAADEDKEVKLGDGETDETQSSPPDLSEMSKAELTDYAKSLGIDVKSNWSVAKITDEIEALQAEG